MSKEEGLKGAAKTREMIMSNPTQREWIRMQRDAEMDRRTEIRAAEKRGAEADVTAIPTCKTMNKLITGKLDALIGEHIKEKRKDL